MKIAHLVAIAVAFAALTAEAGNKAAALAAALLGVVNVLKSSKAAVNAIPAAYTNADPSVAQQITAAAAGIEKADQGVRTIATEIRKGAAPSAAARQLVKQGLVQAKVAGGKLTALTADDASLASAVAALNSV
ncbi:hypothetical protein BDK51DRAFT_33431, partial [Blyttiomyces helicus]